VYRILGLETWVHIVFHPAVSVALLVSRDVRNSNTITDSIAGVHALGHALRTERLEVTAAVVPVADEHIF
jgi:hypothetical protein